MSQDSLLFEDAYRMQLLGKVTKAIKLYETLLKITPNHIQALHFLGLAYAQLGDMQKAFAYLHQALLLDPSNARLHNNLGNAYKEINKQNEAIKHYKQCIKLSPTYAEALHNLATIYALQDKNKQALRYYHLALQAQPNFVQAHFNLGLLFIKMSELKGAKIQFTNVINLQPNNFASIFYLGVLNLNQGLIDEAEYAFKKVLTKDKQNIQALVNLGAIALKREQGQKAVEYFSSALALDNTSIPARSNLAATFMFYDRFENALMHYNVLLENAPDDLEYLYNSGVAEMALGHLTEAINHFEHMLQCNTDNFLALNNLAAIYMRLEDKKTALKFLERATFVNPNDTSSKHMLHALSSDVLTPPTYPEYAKNLFNNYALYYDEHMQDKLEYSLPQHLARFLRELHLEHIGYTIDLGCGTGLNGAILRQISQHLTGIDISSKMLARANTKKIYDLLTTSEILDFLKQDLQKYNLVLALDVLPYFGELNELFLQVAKHLESGGVFIFSTEISTNRPWQLQESARFSHSPGYIQDLCKQYSLTIKLQEKVIARKQQQNDLEEMIFAVIYNKSHTLSTYQCNPSRDH